MIREIPSYSAYRPSSVPWLGDVPAHWEVRRAKTLYREVDERSTTGTEELMSVSHKTGVTPRKRNVTMFLAESNVGYKVCKPGDIVINTMWAYMAALGVARQEGLVSPSYGVYRPLHPKSLSPDYSDLLLRTEEYRMAYLARSTGITDSRLRLYPESFLGIPLLCPPLPEQAAIVRYLDHADRRIRRYVEAKQKLIALLEEEKQAVTNRAVTRGLDPNVHLKPSGVEWLGDVPAHWEVRRLKQVCRLSYGDSLSADSRELGEVPVYGSNGPVGHHSASNTEAPCIIIGRKGSFGKVTYVDRTAFAIDTTFFIDKRYTHANIRWVSHMLPLLGLDTVSHDSAVPGLNRNDAYAASVPLPPFSEQCAIVEHLDRATANIDEAITRARRQIELLEEYRTRLIADVVTGKMDVREAAAQLPDEGP